MKTPDAPADTRLVDCDDGALARLPAFLRERLPGAPALVVADPATWNAAGRDLWGALREAGVPAPRPCVFDAPPRGPADPAASARLAAALRAAAESAPGAPAPVPVAVSAGTIAALCRRAAAEAGAPHLVFATAASTDALAAPFAEPAGLRPPAPLPGPLAVFAEPAVLARAPAPLSAAGYGALMAGVTAGADWILAAETDAADPVDPAAWDLAQDGADDALVRPADVAAREPAALGALAERLALCGAAMQRARSPRPASGAAHDLALVWTLSRAAPAGGPPPRAGHLAAVGALCALAACGRLFEEDFSPDDVPRAVELYPTWETREALIRSLFPAGPLADAALAESRAKHLDPAALRDRLARLSSAWPELRDRVNRQLMHLPRMRAMLRAAGCPSSPAEIGLAPERAAASAIAAQMLRRRRTVLDLAYETGRLAVCAEAVRDAFPPLP